MKTLLEKSITYNPGCWSTSGIVFKIKETKIIYSEHSCEAIPSKSGIVSYYFKCKVCGHTGHNSDNQLSGNCLHYEYENIYLPKLKIPHHTASEKELNIFRGKCLEYEKKYCAIPIEVLESKYYIFTTLFHLRDKKIINEKVKELKLFKHNLLVNCIEII